MSKPVLSAPIPVRFPVEVLADVDAIAATCERTRSWVIVRALRLYLKGEGADVLAVRRGREQIARGEVHEMDDVLGELDVLMAGKTAG